MKGMIFAAGKGERLMPLTSVAPKPLFPVVNKPILQYNIELLAKAGVTDIMINLFHLGDKIQAHFGDGSELGVTLHYSHEESLWGTGGGLKLVEDFFIDEEAFVVINGDTLIDTDIAAAIEAHTQSDAVATMVLCPSADTEQFGAVEIDENNNVVQIAGRIANPKAPAVAGHVFAGVHVLSPRIFEYIPPAIASCINAYAYTKMINNNEQVKAFLMQEDDYWNDLGTPDRYFNTNLDVLERTIKFNHLDPFSMYPQKPKKAETGFVGMGEDVDMNALAQFVPPIALGNAVVVGEEAFIGPSCCIGSDCSIGRKAVISRSVILPGTIVSSKTRLENAIVAGKHRIYVETI